jgi:predicted nuclease of predicted toxin-antitoxin system
MTERYLANENFPAIMVRVLRSAGDDVLYAAEELVAAPDSPIIQAAPQQDRVVLTFDQDFGELVFHHREPPPPGVVLFRLGGLSADGLFTFLRAFFESKPTLRGFFTVASPGRFRQIPITPLPETKTKDLR